MATDGNRSTVLYPERTGFALRDGKIINGEFVDAVVE